jgi:hypothetical protein
MGHSHGKIWKNIQVFVAFVMNIFIFSVPGQDRGE